MNDSAQYLERWHAIAARWPVERFLATAGIELTAPEQRRLRDIHDWRLLVPKYMLQAGWAPDLSQVYCFGMAHGGTVRHLTSGFAYYGIDLPHLNLFDSFQGLPEERPGISTPPVWTPGAYAKTFDAFEADMKRKGLLLTSHAIFQGWFADTLKANLVSDGTFRPALYVDFDADLYRSTRDALDFMFAHRLIRPGTFLGYDDWGDTELWTAGESRAHKEMTEQYGVECRELMSWGEPGLMRKLFLVERVGDAGGSSDARNRS